MIIDRDGNLIKSYQKHFLYKDDKVKINKIIKLYINKK